MSKISVCSTSYNSMGYAEDFLNSIMTIMPDEVIITDNMSDDGTAEFFKSRDVTVIQQSCNRGEGRNLSISASKSDYILIVDTDNKYDFSNIDLMSLTDDKVHVFIDKNNKNSWCAFGKRDVISQYPFSSRNNAEDIVFFSEAPVIFHNVFFAQDLKRDKTISGINIERLKRLIISPSWHYAAGLSTRQILLYSFKKGPILFIIDTALLILNRIAVHLGIIKINKNGH